MTQQQINPFRHSWKQSDDDTAGIVRDKAAHQQLRATLPPEEATTLDEQFKATFEQLEPYFLSKRTGNIEEIYVALKALTAKGGSAVLLGNNELGSYNVAMLIKEIGMMPTEILPTVKAIIRLCIIAGADIYHQKAYIGNGGTIPLEWLLIYLGGGIGRNGLYLTSREQYQCCFEIFPWFIEKGVANLYRFEIFDAFLRDLRLSPEVKDMQESVIHRMIEMGLLPFDTREFYVSASYFRRIALIDIHWLTLIFPYEEPRIKPYLDNLRKNLTDHVIQSLLNAFTSDQQRRKHFRTYFMQRQHWLLQQIISISPPTIFDLVRRNEQDMLMPFLKYQKRELAVLRNADGQSLLQWAHMVRGVSPKTILLLQQASL
ncbi:hypothetical protein ACE38W_02835 [Chitinophaga sp. Hz27]|uniref:hypothetical protein n=1 Tax=Chitinophaga sp. Hz27 TaxID=3347169 RepID=UPI0035DAE8F9